MVKVYESVYPNFAPNTKAIFNDCKEGSDGLRKQFYNFLFGFAYHGGNFSIVEACIL